MYVYGKNVVNELLKTDLKIHNVLLTKQFDDQNLIKLLKTRNIKIEIKDKKELDNLVESNSQGIVASIDDYKYLNLNDVLDRQTKGEYGFVVILDQITDVHNFASIIRVCECVGVDAIIIPKTRSAVVTPSTYKISSGAIFNVDVCMVSNLNNAIDVLKKNGYWIVGSDLATDSSYDTVDYKMNVGLIIGSEGEGIRSSTRKSCDFLVKIPMVGKINSLNASVATGILCYQIFNQRKE